MNSNSSWTSYLTVVLCPPLMFGSINIPRPRRAEDITINTLSSHVRTLSSAITTVRSTNMGLIRLWLLHRGHQTFVAMVILALQRISGCSTWNLVEMCLWEWEMGNGTGKEWQCARVISHCWSTHIPVVVVFFSYLFCTPPACLISSSVEYQCIVIPILRRACNISIQTILCGSLSVLFILISLDNWVIDWYVQQMICLQTSTWDVLSTDAVSAMT